MALGHHPPNTNSSISFKRHLKKSNINVPEQEQSIVLIVYANLLTAGRDLLLFVVELLAPPHSDWTSLQHTQASVILMSSMSNFWCWPVTP